MTFRVTVNTAGASTNHVLVYKTEDHAKQAAQDILKSGLTVHYTDGGLDIIPVGQIVGIHIIEVKNEVKPKAPAKRKAASKRTAAKSVGAK